MCKEMISYYVFDEAGRAPTNTEIIVESPLYLTFDYFDKNVLYGNQGVLPFWWYQRYLLGWAIENDIEENETAVLNGDIDGDGKSNLKEYRYRTDPCDPQSVVYPLEFYLK